MRVTRRTYLVIRALESGQANMFTAMEAVASTAIEHPEWDLDEIREFSDWADEDSWR